jgi:hypothetical protein
MWLQASVALVAAAAHSMRIAQAALAAGTS